MREGSGSVFDTRIRVPAYVLDAIRGTLKEHPRYTGSIVLNPLDVITLRDGEVHSFEGDPAIDLGLRNRWWFDSGHVHRSGGLAAVMPDDGDAQWWENGTRTA